MRSFERWWLCGHHYHRLICVSTNSRKNCRHASSACLAISNAAQGFRSFHKGHTRACLQIELQIYLLIVGTKSCINAGYLAKCTWSVLRSMGSKATGTPGLLGFKPCWSQIQGHWKSTIWKPVLAFKPPLNQCRLVHFNLLTQKQRPLVEVITATFRTRAVPENQRPKAKGFMETWHISITFSIVSWCCLKMLNFFKGYPLLNIWLSAGCCNSNCPEAADAIGIDGIDGIGCICHRVLKWSLSFFSLKHATNLEHQIIPFCLRLKVSQTGKNISWLRDVGEAFIVGQLCIVDPMLWAHMWNHIIAHMYPHVRSG